MKAAAPLLGPGDPAPVRVLREDSRSPFVIVVDHAGRAIPANLGRLGLKRAAFDLHIAWDIGALALARRVGARLGACVIWQPFSRLVVDCNRAPDETRAIVEISDGIAIPGNSAISAAERAARIAEIHAPYHRRIGEIVARRRADGLETVLVCQHSFTPSLAGVDRPWHAGVLHLGGSAMSAAMLAALRGEGDLVVGDNEPYAMDGTDYTAPAHARAHGCEMCEIELRQDLIASAVGQDAWGRRLARLLPAALASAGIGCG